MASNVKAALFALCFEDDMSEAVASNYLINHNRAGQVMIETTGQDNERSKKKPRTNNFFEVTVPSYTPSDFKSHFRMLPSIFEMLCTLIADKMEMSRSVPVTKKILCTIWLLANTESYRSVADRFNVSKGQLHAIVHSVCHALIGLKDQYIKWPRNDKLEEMSKDWAEKHHTHNSRFPGVVGSVDGTYIPIQGCGGQDRDAYICRKGFPAMHLQVVCDSKHRFIDVFTGYPGSVHDARVFKNSNLKRHLDSPDGKLPPQYHLLGDSAYPNCSYLLTPFRDNGHLTGKEKHYNKIHSQLRVTVEHSIGLLKCKFRRLKYLAMGNYAEIPYVIFACCILHNFLLMSNDTDGDEIDVSSFVNEESDPVNYNETFENTDRSGDVKRREISNML